MTPLSIAFVPLTDSAVLVAARERGFAEAEGLDLSLVKCTSWATLRDRLVFGQVQAAHMLAPLAVAVTLGLSQHPARIVAPFRLGMNGNALTLAKDFAAALDPKPSNRISDPVATAHDFASAIGMHRRKPVIGVVHRFSSHALTLRYWLGFAGVDPDRDITLRVLPPSLLVEALRGGEIDGFMAGEPWNSAAVDAGLGEIGATTAAIWPKSVEKTLAARADWAEANGDVLARLVGSLIQAAAWCDNSENHPELAALLAREACVGQPEELIQAGLDGQLTLRKGDAPISQPNFIKFHGPDANRPQPAHGEWIFEQFLRWGMVDDDDQARASAAGVFDDAVYRAVLGDAVAPAAPIRLFDSI